MKKRVGFTDSGESKTVYEKTTVEEYSEVLTEAVFRFLGGDHFPESTMLWGVGIAASVFVVAGRNYSNILGLALRLGGYGFLGISFSVKQLYTRVMPSMLEGVPRKEKILTKFVWSLPNALCLSLIISILSGGAL